MFKKYFWNNSKIKFVLFLDKPWANNHRTYFKTYFMPPILILHQYSHYRGMMKTSVKMAVDSVNSVNGRRPTSTSLVDVDQYKSSVWSKSTSWKCQWSTLTSWKCQCLSGQWSTVDVSGLTFSSRPIIVPKFTLYDQDLRFMKGGKFLSVCLKVQDFKVS